MDIERFIEIMSDDEIGGIDLGKKDQCKVFEGLKIIDKYLPGVGIVAAEHDIIYSADVEDIVAAGIIESDVEKLRRLNWMVESDEYLSCFV